MNHPNSKPRKIDFLIWLILYLAAEWYIFIGP